VKSQTLIHWHPGDVLPFKDRLCHLSIGVFDGLHLGHRNIIQHMLNQKKSIQDLAIVITFKRNPKQLKNPNSFAGNLTEFNERINGLMNLGVDAVLAIDFSEDFSKMDGGVFIGLLLNTLRLRSLTVGHDFSMGYRSSTKAQDIRNLLPESIQLFIMPPVFSSYTVISSSQIRKLLLEGNVLKANQMLGHPFRYVIPNSGNEFSILPKDGDYIVLVHGVRNTICIQSRVLVCKFNLQTGMIIEFIDNINKE